MKKIILLTMLLCAALAFGSSSVQGSMPYSSGSVVPGSCAPGAWFYHTTSPIGYYLCGPGATYSFAIVSSTIISDNSGNVTVPGTLSVGVGLPADATVAVNKEAQWDATNHVLTLCSTAPCDTIVKVTTNTANGTGTGGCGGGGTVGAGKQCAWRAGGSGVTVTVSAGTNTEGFMVSYNASGTVDAVGSYTTASALSSKVISGQLASAPGGAGGTALMLEFLWTKTGIVTAMSGASTTAVSAGASLNAAANTPTCVDGSSQLTTVGCTGGSSTNAELPLVNVAIAAGTNRFLGAQTSSTVEVNVQNIAHATMHVVGMVCAVSAALGSGCSGGVCHATYTLRIGAFGSAGSNGSNSCVVTTSGSCTSTAADTITAGQAFSVLDFTDTSATSVAQTCTITYHE